MISGLTAGGSEEASSGVLYAGGLITGEALMGIFLAIPIAISGRTNVLHILPEVRDRLARPVASPVAADVVPEPPSHGSSVISLVPCRQ
jgi:hypothetical protein